MKKFILIFFIIFGLLYFSVATYATSFIAECQDIDYVFDSANIVAFGEVVKVESKWDNNSIYTYVDFKVDHYLKGKDDDTVVVKQLGGAIGNVATSVAGFPNFKVGQRGHLYLEKNEGKFYRVVCGYGVTNTLPASIPRMLYPKTRKPNLLILSLLAVGGILGYFILQNSKPHQSDLK
ncbi:MAG: hypothetical protein Q8R08_03360 [bacterium]|nr:hypothetical protein [bacterium]